MQLSGPGIFGPPRDRETALAVLREAVSSGVNHIDTSDYYGPHITNQLIREALHPYPDDLVIVTKIGARRGEDASWLPASSPAELRQAVHDNLRNLSLDVLDVVNLRNMLGIEASMEAPLTVLADLQRQGLVRHIGLSNVTPAQIAEGRRICEIVCVQNHYNVAHRNDDALIDTSGRRSDRLCAVFSARRIHAASVIRVIRCGAGSWRDANASRARVVASPGAKHSSHSWHVVVGASSREPRSGGARSARRSTQTVGRRNKSACRLIPQTNAKSLNA